MFQSTHLFLLIVLLGVVMISAIAGPMIQKVELFQTQVPVCSTCQQKDQCTCYQNKSTSTITTPTSTSTTATTSSPEVTAEQAANDQLGKYPMPFWKFVEETRETEKEQSKHIDDIRKVLSSTIKTLREDDVLPSGSACGCTDLPKVDPLTGMVEESDGCRPPGWLRMINSRNAEETDGTCK